MLEAERQDNGSEHSLRGEAAHWCGEQKIRNPQSMIGQECPNGVIIDQEIDDCANVYANDVRATAPLDALRIEERIDIPSINPMCFGTDDVDAYEPVTKTLYLWEYKHGRGLVEAPDNWQGVCYTAGLIDKYRLIDTETRVVFRVIQPRGFHRSGPVREWVFRASDIRGKINKLAAAAKEAVSDNPRFYTGPHCRYCKARTECEALRNAVYYALDIIEQSTVMPADSRSLGLERHLLAAASERIKALLDAVDAELERRIKSGDASTGWSIDNQPGRLDWIADRARVEMTGQLYGVPLTKTELITPTQAIKKGVPEPIIKQLAARKNSVVLKPTDETIAAKAFQNNLIRR